MQAPLSKLLMKALSERGGAERWVEDGGSAHATCTKQGEKDRERMKEAGGLAYRPLQLEH